MADQTFHIPDLPSRWPRRLLWLLPLLPVILAAAAFVHQGRFLAERALRLSLGDGPLAYSLSMPGLDGSLRLSGLAFATDSNGTGWLRADQVQISGHGWWWLLRNALRQKRLEAPLERLEVRFSGLRVAPLMDPALGELQPAGLSGAPFETLGCPADVQFDAETLSAAGLAWDNQLSFRFRVEGSRLSTHIGYQLSGSARFERELRQRLPMPLSLLVIDQYPMRTLEERWRIEDLGFGRIRNRLCAERGEMIALVDRHVARAQEQAQAAGLAASAEAWASYRRFVRDGGVIELDLRYPQPAPLDGWFDRPRPASLLALTEAKLRRDQQEADFVPADALTDGIAGESHKRSQRLQLGGTLWIDPDKALVLLEPERSVAAPEPEPPAPVAASAEPAAPVTEPPPSAPPAGARDRTELIPEARIVVVGEQASRRLEWPQLEDRIGARLRITTRTGSTRVAELVAWSPGEITIRQRIGGGVAESRIQREMVREVVEL